jgi:diphthamide biosynthesis methyltransferase
MTQHQSLQKHNSKLFYFFGNPESVIENLIENNKIDAHTLFLLDLKPNENKFLTIPQAIDILLEINNKRVADGGLPI